MKLQELSSNLAKIDDPIFFISPVLSRALGLEKVLPNFHLITIKRDPLIKILRDNQISVFCLEEHSEIIPKNSFELLSNEFVLNFIKAKSAGKIPNILSFKSLPQLKALCEKYKFKYLASDPFIARDLEDKVFFQELLLENGIFTFPSQIRTLENCEFTHDKMVLQLRHGFAGNSTFLIQGQAEFLKFQNKYAKHKVKLTPFIPGLTLTINCCLTDTNFSYSPFFQQIDQAFELNKNILGTSGNSHFSENIISAEQKNEVYKMVENIAGVILKKGFRGFFGLDLRFGEDGKIYPIEINPRLTASVGNFTQMEISQNKIPLLLQHICHFLNIDLNVKEKNIADLNYSFLIFRNIKAEEIIITNDLKSGIYKYSDANIFFSRDSINFTECERDELFLLPASKDKKIKANEEYLYLLTKERLYENGLLNDKANKIIQLLKNTLLE